VVKLLYNSYHFTLAGSAPRKVNSGVAQESLLSPLFFDWHINDLVVCLKQKFGIEYVFAYADDIAIICLGYNDLREAVSCLESWCRTNGASLNNKKCGILRVTNRESRDMLKELKGIPFVKQYKYLGVPLDQSLTLKTLVSMMKIRVKKFNTRIGYIMHNVVSLKARLNLWSTYIRCIFDYFAPALALCEHTSKVERLFTKSLKLSLDLPMQTSNCSVLYAAGMPSLMQIAAHHIVINEKIIQERYGKCPDSVARITQELQNEAKCYQDITNRERIKWDGSKRVLSSTFYLFRTTSKKQR